MKKKIFIETDMFELDRFLKAGLSFHITAEQYTA